MSKLITCLACPYLTWDVFLKGWSCLSEARIPRDFMFPSWFKVKTPYPDIYCPFPAAQKQGAIMLAYLKRKELK